jgi:hypothetical protein
MTLRGLDVRRGVQAGQRDGRGIRKLYCCQMEQGTKLGEGNAAEIAAMNKQL